MFDIYSYCAQQIKAIEAIKYQDKTIGGTYNVGGIPLNELLHPLFASYYLPLVMNMNNVQMGIYNKLFYFKQGYTRLLSILKYNTFKKPSFIKNKKKAVLFLNFSENHYSQIFDPVTNLPEYMDNFSTYILGLTNRTPENEHINLNAYFSQDKYKKLMFEAPGLDDLKSFQKIATDAPDLDKKAKILRINYFQLLKISLLFQLPIFVKIIQMGISLYEDIEPSVVISGDFCDPRCIVLFLLAKARRIPTMVIQQGLLTEACSDFYFPIVDKIALWDNTTFEMINKIKAPSQLYVITGNPGYDRYAKSQPPDSLNQKNILLISQPHHRHGISRSKMEKMKREILQSTTYLDGYHMIIKPHPDEKRNWYDKQIKKMNIKNVTVLDPDDDTKEWIQKADALIGFYSTALMEGIAIGRPVMIFDDDGEYNRYAAYEKEGAAYGVKDKESIRNFLLSYEKNEQIRQTLQKGMNSYIKRHMGPFDGKSAERVYNLMVSLLKDI